MQNVYYAERHLINKNRISFSATFFDKSSSSGDTTDNISSREDQSCGSKAVQKNAAVDSMINQLEVVMQKFCGL